MHEEVIARITGGIESCGFKCTGVTESPLKGDRGGNTEFLAHFVHEAGAPPLRVPDAMAAAAAGPGAAAAAAAREQQGG